MLVLDHCSKKDKIYNFLCDFARTNYWNRLRAKIELFPEYFVYVQDNFNLLGCVGLTPGDVRNPLLVETYFDFDLLNFLSENNNNIKRSEFAEIGTLSIVKNNYRITIILVAGVILLAYKKQIKYVALTAHKTIQRLSVPLKINIINIGKPSLNKKDAFFKKNWEKYFRINPDSIGFSINQAITGSLEVLKKFESEGLICLI